MRVNVRDIAAQCPRCGAEEFDDVAGRPASHASLRCSGCGASESYADLIMQIARKALTLSERTLEEIRRRRPG